MSVQRSVLYTPMAKKDKHFDMRMSEQESEALNRLAEHAGKSKSEVVIGYIKRTTKKLGIWPKPRRRNG